jgi:rSAM/selenodomain-associated transferase 1
MLLTPDPKKALLIFTRNPELGKCKTRLAATVGEDAALSIYLFLLKKTATVTSGLPDVDKLVFFSERLGDGSIWDPLVFNGHVQRGEELGSRMRAAFEHAFEAGYSKVLLIGSDLFDLYTDDLQTAFAQLDSHDAVLGPAIDGGYYLIGLNRLLPKIFEDKAWGDDTVLEKTLANLEGLQVYLLPERNDVDQYEDIAGRPEFKPFLKHLPDDPKTTG